MKYRFLVTNDDGFAAPGIVTLAGVARQVGDAHVVAPVDHCSGAGHQVTTQKPVRLHTHAPDDYAVEGWPVDCVRVALRGLALDVDWVLSGINAGGNLGADVHISGTVAAVREGVLLGKRGIAFSHYKRRDREYDWERVARWTKRVLEELLDKPCPLGCLWNVNFPHPDAASPDPDLVVCPLDPHPLPVQYRREGDLFIYAGDYHGRPRDQGTDVEVCLGGKIAATLLRVHG